MYYLKRKAHWNNITIRKKVKKYFFRIIWLGIYLAIKYHYKNIIDIKIITTE